MGSADPALTALQAGTVAEEAGAEAIAWSLETTDFRQKPAQEGGPNRGRANSEAESKGGKLP